MTPAVKVANAVAEYLRGLTAADLAGFQPTITQPEYLDKARPDQPLEIAVFAHAERETRQGRGLVDQAIVEADIAIVTLAKLGPDGYTRDNLLGLAHALRRKLRGRQLAGYHWQAASVEVLYETDALKSGKLFMALSVVTFTGVDA